PRSPPRSVRSTWPAPPPWSPAPRRGRRPPRRARAPPCAAARASATALPVACSLSSPCLLHPEEPETRTRAAPTRVLRRPRPAPQLHHHVMCAPEAHARLPVRRVMHDRDLVQRCRMHNASDLVALVL